MMNEVDNNLKISAEEAGATHVFGIEYKSMAGSHHGGTIGYGDAYKQRE